MTEWLRMHTAVSPLCDRLRMQTNDSPKHETAIEGTLLTHLYVMRKFRMHTSGSPLYIYMSESLKMHTAGSPLCEEQA